MPLFTGQVTNPGWLAEGPVLASKPSSTWTVHRIATSNAAGQGTDPVPFSLLQSEHLAGMSPLCAASPSLSEKDLGVCLELVGLENALL